MNLTHTVPPASLPAAAPVVTAALPRRRRPGLIAAGVVIVVLGALGAFAIATTAADTRPYLAVATTVTAGARLADADLTVVQLSPVSGLTPVPVADRARMVGQYAKVELAAGTLLTAGQLTEQALPGPGRQLIGLDLTSAQLPGRQLRPGEPVLLVITADPRGTSTDAGGSRALPNPPTFPATVAGLGGPGPDGQVVDVVVDAALGPGLLERASQGRVAIALAAR